ncbi:class I SAM-dependent methyltransferase [Candidatus Woesearchaeota archaeon]|nr:class I SAM-dependent methyltransferase [Candidatus Woesearchaeota archaeon]
MEKFTKKGISKTWGNKVSIKARVKRGKGTSAPIKEELEIYKKFLRQTIVGDKNPRVLVLGVTPELVDLAVSLGCETVVVDISKKLIEKMRAVMKYRDSPKLHIVHGDWLKMDKILNTNSFNAIIGDASLNNIPAKKYPAVLKNISKLLKKNGSLIVRHLIYSLPKKFKTKEQAIKEFKQGRNTILGVFMEVGFQTKIAKKAYNAKKNQFSWEHICDPTWDVLKANLGKKDLKYVENLGRHARYVIHNLFPKKVFNKMLQKHFVVKKIAVLKKYMYSRYCPIYFAKKKSK